MQRMEQMKSKTVIKAIRILFPHILLTACFFLSSCDSPQPETGISAGTWRGSILAQSNEIPFNFEVVKDNGALEILLINGDESLVIDEVNILGDSLFFNMHIFDIRVKAKILKDSLNGVYIKNYAEDYVLPFHASYGKAGRFDDVKSSGEFDGTWETTFISDDGKETPAVGIFRNEQGTLKGTFLTKTGDYRYLDGFTDRDTMYLYTFDGNHLYRFKAHKETDSIMKGEFWSGKTGYKTFISVRNDSARLPDPNELTFLKEGYDKISFSFPDLEGRMTTLEDEKYQGKVIVLQILGTWCPNCMDETRFYADWYRKNAEKGVEIIGLAYEVKPDFEYAKVRVQSMKEKLQVPYDVLIAGTATTRSASASLPMLNEVISFPTSLIIDKKGTVRRIHTGFSGPATGIYFEEYVDDFNRFMKELLEE